MSAQKVKDYLLELGYEITHDDEAEQLFVISAPEKGIAHMILDCEGDVLVIEQYLFNIDAANADHCKRLLQLNRTVVHGAFVLDEEGRRVIFRDTLQLSNLDINELESSINSLSLALAENGSEFLSIAAK